MLQRVGVLLLFSCCCADAQQEQTALLLRRPQADCLAPALTSLTSINFFTTSYQLQSTLQAPAAASRALTAAVATVSLVLCCCVVAVCLLTAATRQQQFLHVGMPSVGLCGHTNSTAQRG